MPAENHLPSTVDMLSELITGWFASRAVYVAAELGIADVLHDGPKSISEIARATGAHQPSLYRLLRMLDGYGVFAENIEGCFELTSVAALLEGRALRDVARMCTASTIFADRDNYFCRLAARVD
jgi:DNA-binding IclR family transcriptional regulator